MKIDCRDVYATVRVVSKSFEMSRDVGLDDEISVVSKSSVGYDEDSVYELICYANCSWSSSS